MNKPMRVKPVRPATGLGTGERRLPRGLTNMIVWRAVGDLREFPGNPRRHPESQIVSLMQGNFFTYAAWFN